MTNPAKINPLRTLFRSLMLLLIVAYLCLVAYLWVETLAKTRADLTYTDSFLVQAIRTTLKDHELILRGLGSELVAEGVLDKPEKGQQLIDRMKKIDPGIVGFGLARPDGQLILISNTTGDPPLPNLLQHPETKDSFQAALVNEHLRTGRPYYFKLLNDWVVPIRVSIRNEFGQVQAIMTAGYSIENATTAWSNVTLLPEVTVALIGDDGYPRYISPFPKNDPVLTWESVFGHPIEASILEHIASIRQNHAFVEMNLPRSGGNNFVAYSRIAEYGLHAGAFIPRSVVVNSWLQQLIVPTLLTLIFFASGVLTYRRAVQQQVLSHSAIRRLSAWQQAVLDGADYSIISTDTKGTIVSFNKTAQRILGYSPEEMVGKTPELIHDYDEVEQRAAELSQELQTTIVPGFEVFVAKARRGEIEEREWTYIRKDGSRFPVRLSVTPLSTDEGSIIGFLGIADDLSEQKAIRGYLRDSQARYQILFERASDAIFLMKNERFIDCNPATLIMFGCSREQIVGESPVRYSPQTQPDGRSSAEKAMDKITAAYAGQTQFFEWRHVRHDGTPFDAEVALNVVEVSGEPHLLATVRDISARKRNEQELEHSRQQLIRQNESLRMINQLSQRLHGSLDLDEILQETVQTLLGLSSTPNIAIYLIHPEDDQQLLLCASHGFPPELTKLGHTMPRQSSLSGLALTEGKILEAKHISEDNRLYTSIKTALTRMGAKQAVSIPMFYQKNPLGNINLVYDYNVDLVQTEKDTLTSLGNTVALAIANSQHVQHLAYLARHDSLTQLPNRMLLHETINAYISSAVRQRKHVALMLLDLDRFKDINDTLGHQIGDQVLKQIGQRLDALCSEHDAINARLGGDEFAIGMIFDSDTSAPIDMAKQSLHTLHQPFLVEGIELSLGASIGVAYYPEHGDNSHALLRAADVAMYHAKERSAGLMIYDSEFDKYSTERLTLASELVQAVGQDQLVLHYQPKIQIASGDIVGFEALVRWNHPRLGLLYPNAFLQLAEMSEIIHSFTSAVIELAARDKQRLHQLGYDQPIAVNLSAINLGDSRCLDSLKQAIKRHKLHPTEIELELTETAVMHEGDTSMNMLQSFKEMGINIAIDDFGTGYSSLSYLRRLPIQALKIDRSFVKDMLLNQQDSTIVRSTIDLAHNLDLQVIAEGVEDNETLMLLRNMGCDQAQGFGICRPQPFERLIDWLSEGERVISV